MDGTQHMRERLPNRRRQITDITRWPLAGGRSIHVSAGLAPDGRILETFLRGGGRVGSETDFLLDDVAVILSRLLQHGDTIELIARGVGRLPDGSPASMVGAAVDVLQRLRGAQVAGA
jgi:hypothetical protein